MPTTFIFDSTSLTEKIQAEIKTSMESPDAEAPTIAWCMDPANLPTIKEKLTEFQREQLVDALLQYGRFEPNEMDHMVKISSFNFLSLHDGTMPFKGQWVRWVKTHLDEQHAKDAIILWLEMGEKTTAKEMLEGGSYGWNTNLWPLFPTEKEFIAVITMAARHAPSEFILRIPWICAYLAKFATEQIPGDDVWGFIPENRKSAWRLGQSQFYKIQQILDNAMARLGDGERIHPHVIRLLTMESRADAIWHCRRIDEGVELSIHLMIDLENRHSEPRHTLYELLRRMTPQNAPYVYCHALACGFDPEDGEHGYWKTTKVKPGRHHTGRQSDTFSQRAPEVTKTPRDTLVRNAWFYQTLRNRVVECGWAFVKPTLKDRGDRLEDIQVGAPHGQFVWTTFPMSIMGNVILRAYFAHGLDVIVPASRVWDPNETGRNYILFDMPVLFDAPYGYDRSDGDWTEFNAPKTGR